MDGAMCHLWETGNMNTQFLWGDLRGRNHLENLGIDGRIKAKLIFKKWDGEAWNGLISLRIGTGACECGNERAGMAN